MYSVCVCVYVCARVKREYVCEYAYAYMCVYVYVHVRVRACLCMCAHVFVGIMCPPSRLFFRTREQNGFLKARLVDNIYVNLTSHSIT